MEKQMSYLDIMKAADAYVFGFLAYDEGNFDTKN